MNLVKMIAHYDTQTVRETIHLLHTPAGVLKLICQATADLLCGDEARKYEAMDHMHDLFDQGRSLGLSDAQMSAEIAKAGR